MGYYFTELFPRTTMELEDRRKEGLPLVDLVALVVFRVAFGSGLRAGKASQLGQRGCFLKLGEILPQQPSYL